MDEPSRPVDPRIDRRIWRVVGDPLLPSGDHKDDHPGVPTGDHEPAGELAGLRVAVKDLFAVAGFALTPNSRICFSELTRSGPALASPMILAFDAWACSR